MAPAGRYWCPQSHAKGKNKGSTLWIDLLCYVKLIFINLTYIKNEHLVFIYFVFHLYMKGILLLYVCRTNNNNCDEGLTTINNLVDIKVLSKFDQVKLVII